MVKPSKAADKIQVTNQIVLDFLGELRKAEVQAHGLDQNEGKTTWLSLQSSKTEERAMRYGMWWPLEGATAKKSVLLIIPQEEDVHILITSELTVMFPKNLFF